MKITPINIVTSGGKIVRRYLAEYKDKGIVVQVTGHTHMYAIHNAFKVIMQS